MNNLTLQEFGMFKLKGKNMLIQKDAKLQDVRFYSEQVIGELFVLYDFYVERIINLMEERVIDVYPISQSLRQANYPC